LIGPAGQGHKSQKYIMFDRQQVAAKDQLRAFYGVDRVDNAFFVSESVDEALVEEAALFA